mgnify:CR=1 FL=1
MSKEYNDLPQGMSVTNTCYECLVIERDGMLDDSKPCYECEIIAQDRAKGYPAGFCGTCADKAMLKATNYEAGKCATCLKNEEARSDQKAWDLHEDDRLGEGLALSTSHQDEPSASDWVESKSYTGYSRKARIIEKWVSDTGIFGEATHLELYTVEFDEPEITERSEFLPPIAQLIDGGVFEELWELDDERQRGRERECIWCHIMTPRIYDICQNCDNPLESNVR